MSRPEAFESLANEIRQAPAVSTEGADIKGYLKPDVIETDSYLLTTGRTLGCLILLHYDQISDEESLTILPTVSPA